MHGHSAATSRSQHAVAVDDNLGAWCEGSTVLFVANGSPLDTQHHATCTETTADRYRPLQTNANLQEYGSYKAAGRRISISLLQLLR